MGLWKELNWRIGMHVVGLDPPIVQHGRLRTLDGLSEMEVKSEKKDKEKGP